MDKKEMYWSHWKDNTSLPSKFTKKRLEKVKPIVMKDKRFWDDILIRHNGIGIEPELMRKIDLFNYGNCMFNYGHCMSNMTGMVYELMLEHKIVKN